MKEEDLGVGSQEMKEGSSRATSQCQGRGAKELNHGYDL